MVKKGEKGNRDRKDYTVHVISKDGDRVSYNCGASLRGAKNCLQACQHFGGKVIKHGVIVATAHTKVVGDQSILSPEQLEELD